MQSIYCWVLALYYMDGVAWMRARHRITSQHKFTTTTASPNHSFRSIFRMYAYVLTVDMRVLPSGEAIALDCPRRERV